MKESKLADLTADYLALGPAGRVERAAGGDEFWSLPPEEIEKFGESWLVTEFYFDEDWKTWEMHPHGEEIVYLLSGAIDLILERDGKRETLELREKGVTVVGRGVWHTAKVLRPANLLVVTHGRETQVRPVD
jgi:mannose-6-phosphate isomerase-like protein (cupin superfamily)